MGPGWFFFQKRWGMVELPKETLDTPLIYHISQPVSQPTIQLVIHSSYEIASTSNLFTQSPIFLLSNQVKVLYQPQFNLKAYKNFHQRIFPSFRLENLFHSLLPQI